MKEPVTRLKLEAPGGLIGVEAQCAGGKVERVKIANVPSFADKLDQKLEVAGVGSISADTAYGGDSFVLVSAPELGFALDPDEARDLATLGAKITDAANEQLGFTHPLNDDWNHISFCQFTYPVQQHGDHIIGRNTVSIKPGKLDRSPCGTGCSARMAVMHARGELSPGDTFIGRSIIDSEFICKIESEVNVGPQSAIIPSISGRAWITGTHQHTLDPRDPWPLGYRLSDTWPAVGKG